MLIFTYFIFQYSFFQKKTSLPNGDIKWEGLTFDLLNELAFQLNFTLVIYHYLYIITSLDVCICKRAYNS